MLALIFADSIRRKAQRAEAQRAEQRSGRSSRSSGRSSKSSVRSAKDEAQVLEPDVDEMRKKRVEHFDEKSPRKRGHGSDTTVKDRSKTSSSEKAKSVTKSEGRSTTRRLHSSTGSTPQRGDDEQAVSEGERRTEEYVYGSRPGALEPIDEERQAGEASRASQESGAGTPDVHPDDSISQVGSRTRTKQSGKGNVRPSARRSSTTSTKLDRVPEEPSRQTSAKSKKGSSGQAAASAPPRRHSTTSIPAPRPPVECLTCGTEDIPAEDAAELTCGHIMCHGCLRTVFELSVKDPAHMPPKCCKEEHIPLLHVANLFDDKFKATWNRKYQEYHTNNRLYCPMPKCAHWIKPKHIHTKRGRKYATCPKCFTKICGECKGKEHGSTKCPKESGMAQLVETAKEEGWQRCYKCKAMVERISGCNHMTCRCRAQFCIKCAAKWKTCPCPWWDNDAYSRNGRLMRDVMAERMRERQEQDLNLEFTYQQQMDQRREQERLDADLARRLQLAAIFDNDDEPHRERGNDDWDWGTGNAARHPFNDDLLHRERNNDDGFWGTGNAARHFLNDDFVQLAANFTMDGFGEPGFGRRGERASGRRRRARNSGQNDGDPGLPGNFLGDESVLGFGPAR